MGTPEACQNRVDGLVAPPLSPTLVAASFYPDSIYSYMYSFTFRNEMADLFRDESCIHWWLPNNKHYSPIIRSIRTFVAHAKDVSAEDFCDLKAIFSSLELDEEIH